MSAMRCHPDRHASGSDEDKAKAEVMFKEVGEAFEILSDPEKKQRYDQVTLPPTPNPNPNPSSATTR